MINEWDLSQTNLHRLTGREIEVVVLPLGAIEPHNQHLPEGMDWFHTTHIAREICKRAWEKSNNILCLPAIPYGVDCNLMDFPIAVHVSQATLDLMIQDIVFSLYQHGIQKIVLFNGHGGNDFTPLIRQLQCDLDVHLFLCNWWRVGMDKYNQIFEKPDDHAGEFETSIALALYPELVELEKAGSGEVRPFRFEALNKGWVQTSRRFSRMNDNCAAGNPAGATAEKGKKYLEIVMNRMTDFLVQLAQDQIDMNFPHIE